MAERPAPPSQQESSVGLALRFISGKYQGGEFPLREGLEIIVGRSSELDMVLVEEMVSRKHARIVTAGGTITIEDLGSTNGTFVNGEKIKAAPLKLGDRVLIGTSILKVVNPSTRSAKATSPTTPGMSPVAAPQPKPRRGEEAPRMTGNLEEIPLPDLLQLFGTSRKTGVLVLRKDDDVARIHLHQGLVRHAEIQSKPQLAPIKAVYRMLTWLTGLFELEPPEQREFANPVDAGVQEVLMEGFRQQDELQAKLLKLPALTARLILRTPLEAPLHELEPPHLELLQQALNSPSFGALLDKTPMTDLDAALVVESLIKRGYLIAAN